MPHPHPALARLNRSVATAVVSVFAALAALVAVSAPPKDACAPKLPSPPPVSACTPDKGCQKPCPVLWP